MATKLFTAQCELDADPASVFRWHARPGAFVRLIPPWEDIELSGTPATLHPGQLQDTVLRIGPIRRTWIAEIESVDGERGFVDVQRQGPFKAWRHEHTMRASEGAGPERTQLQDRIEYSLPCSPWADLLTAGIVRRRLERTFAYRHRVTAMDLKRHANSSGSAPLDILVSGASGLLGTALCAFLTTGGHRVRRLVRRAPQGPDEFHWDSLTGTIDPGAAEGTDAVVHLAGENIAGGRWTPHRKDLLGRSRTEGTRHVADAIRAADSKPHTFLTASAVGIYGNRGDEELVESSAAGHGFLADLCHRWESHGSNLGGLRTAQLRFGVILSAKGGALRKMLMPFKLGLGGKLGSGKQWMSWIALDDAVAAIHHVLTHPNLTGPINMVSPHPVTNADFTRALGKALHRPTILPMPACAARLAFGELADELLLASQRVRPERLLESGFEFGYGKLDEALAHVLGT